MSIKLKKLLKIQEIKQQITEVRVLSEGFFSSLAKLFKGGRGSIKKSKKVYGSLKDLNGSISELERALQKETGRRIKLQKINLKDLYK